MNKLFASVTLLFICFNFSKLQGQSIVATYTDRSIFLSEYQTSCNTSSELINEQFLGGPKNITVCGPIISSVGDDCFPPNEIEDDINIQMSDNINTILLPAFGDVSVLIGSETFSNYPIINFTEDNYLTIGLDIWRSTASTTLFRVYNRNDVLIEEISLNLFVNQKNFFGVTTDVSIGRVEIESVDNSSTVIGDLLFGFCDFQLSMEEHSQSAITLYPNPTKDLIFFQLPSYLEVEKIVLHDILGNKIKLMYDNESIDMSKLPNGIYLLTIQTNNGNMLVRKVVKSAK